MRGLTDFDAGELVTIDGQDWRFDGLVPPDRPRDDGSCDLQFLHSRNRKAISFEPQEFLAAYHHGLVKFHRTRVAPGDRVGDDENSTKALQRRQRLFWTTIYDADPVPKSVAKLAAFIAAHQANQPDPIAPPSPGSLIRWLRDRGEPGDRRPRQMGNRQQRRRDRRITDPIIVKAYNTAVDRFWTNYKVTKKDVCIAVRAAVIRENDRRHDEGLPPIKVPGETTIWRWINRDRTYENVMTREGRHIADREFKALRGSANAKRIMDTVVLDHKLMDVHVCDSTRTFVIGRPWLALAIDVKSRMVVGLSLSFEDPSVLSLMACVRSILRGQPDLREQFPKVEGDWEAFGVPSTLVVDNAWENTGSSFVDACLDNGISIEWAPVRKPQHKGICERFFSTLDKQLAHKLPGAVTGPPHALASRRIDPTSDACLTLQDLRALIFQYIVDVYSMDMHTGITAVPLSVWRSEVDRCGIQLAHDLASSELTLATMVRDRTLTHEGVKFKGLTYNSEAVDGLLADLLPNQPASQRSGTATIKLKFHPEDISRVFVWNDVKATYVPIPCTDQEYANGLSMRAHEELQASLRASNEEFVSADERVLRKAALQKDVEASYGRMPIRNNRRRARMFSSKNAQVPAIAIDSMSKRSGGDDPEKAPVRSRKSRPALPVEPMAASADVEVEDVAFDPFVERDRGAALQEALERLA